MCRHGQSYAADSEKNVVGHKIIFSGFGYGNITCRVRDDILLSGVRLSVCDHWMCSG
jgi:hypothetical protein